MLIRLGCAFILSASLQVPSPPQRSNGLIVGQVVDADSGRPVAAAIVWLAGPPGPNGQPHPRVLTGSDGRFVFRDVRRGEYNITAIKAGYADGAYGRSHPAGLNRSLSINDGERNGAVVIRVWRLAAISGTILDESGERLVGVQVRAFRRSVAGGRRRFLATSSAPSDDRGIYRIGNLIPGDYVVATISRQTIVPLSLYRNLPPGANERNIPVEAGLLSPAEGTGLAVLPVGNAGLVLGRGSPTPPPMLDGRLAIYPPTFHPSTTQGSAGTMITLRPGEEHVNADLQLAAVPTVRVAGALFGPEGPINRASLRLVPTNAIEMISELDAMTTLTDMGGNFTFPAVPSGHYNIRLSMRGGFASPGAPAAGLVWLDTPLTVGTEPIDNLVLSAAGGVRITGRVDFEGGAKMPAMGSISIMIEPADIVPGTMAYYTRASTDGTFTTTPLPGGRYYVRVQNSPAGWMFKSAAIEGRDVADVPLDLRQEPTSVVITFTDRWSGIRGSVQGAAGRDNDPLVIVFPGDRETWGSTGLSPRRVRSARPSASGEYSFNLPAGDYYVAAIPVEQSADWQDPDFLDAATRSAARVTIVEGERKSQNLRVQEVR